MHQPPVVISAPYLQPVARRLVADRSMTWAADQATATLAKLNIAAGSIEAFADLLASPTTRSHAIILQDLACATARVLILARVAQVYCDVAGAFAPEAVVERLAHFPDAGTVR